MGNHRLNNRLYSCYFHVTLRFLATSIIAVSYSVTRSDPKVNFLFSHLKQTMLKEWKKSEKIAFSFLRWNFSCLLSSLSYIQLWWWCVVRKMEIRFGKITFFEVFFGDEKSNYTWWWSWAWGMTELARKKFISDQFVKFGICNRVTCSNKHRRRRFSYNRRVTLLVALNIMLHSCETIQKPV